MIKSKYILILTFSLTTSIFLGACGTQAPAEPTEASAPQSSDPQPAPATEAAVPTEEPEEPAPTEAPMEESDDPPAGEVSFANDVLPIIKSRCLRCHSGDRIEEGLLMTSYESILAGSDNGPVVVPGDVEGSLLVELVASQEMPKRGPKLTPPQVQIISDWVAAGAPNN